MTKLSSTGFLRARLQPVLALVMLLVFTGSAFADQFYFTRSRTGAVAEDGATGLFLWNDATGGQSQVGGDGVYLRHVPDGPMQVDGIALNSGVLYGFALDDTANGSLLPFPAVVTNVCTPSIQSRLVTIDTSTAVFDYVGSSWLTGRHFTGAGFDSQGRLWALDCTSGEVIQIDLATGNTMGSPIATGLVGQSASDLDFAANGLGIIGYSGLQFRVFNPTTSSVADVPITAVNGTAPNAFDSGLVPPYGVSGVAFTTHVAARNGSPAAETCRLNIFEGRGVDELGHANDPFFANPLIAFKEADQYNPPSPPWNAGSGDAARLGGPALPDCFYDWGDAPASYGTLSANNGPRHLVTATSPYLGSGLPDFEVDGVPNAAANGDDANGADEDGVVIPVFERDATVAIQVTVGNATGATRLNAWIDWNGDGSFAEPGDQIIVDATPVNGVNTFNITVPSTAVFGNSFARFRIADESGLTHLGAASSGEVEDHLVSIEARRPDDYFPACPISQVPPPSNFTIQQRWATPNVAGQRTLPYQTPVVGDLFGNGQIVAVVASDNGFLGSGVGEPAATAKDLHIIRGTDGALLHTIVTPRFNWFGHAVVAIADVDGDGVGEIFMKSTHHDEVPAAQRGRLYAYKFNGTSWAQMWVSNTRYDYANNTANTNGDRRSGHALSVADFNGDGIPEIFIGNQIFNARTGVRLAAMAATASAGCALPDCIQGATVAVDMDGDGQLELAAGNVVYKVTITNPSGAGGNSITPWQTAQAVAQMGDGWTAIADIDLDGDPDVVVVRWSTETRLFVWDGQTNAVLGSAITGVGNVGGEALIGDIDADGGPEIVFVTANQLNAYDFVPGPGGPGTKLVRKWGVATNDASGMTSFAMFDFNSDGKQELVYRDETHLRIVDGSGATATNLATFACQSGTRAEMPVVAALDSTGEARILVTCGLSGTAADFNARGSLRAYQTASFPWAATRPVWNQQTYFVTHINDDLSVPTPQFPHWAVFSDPGQSCSNGVNRPLNGFQQQVGDLDQSTGCPVLCPLPANVSIDKTASSDVAIPGGTVTYTVVVTNTGPGVATGSLVQDPFPAGIASATWTCAASGGATCPNPTSGGTVLPPGFMVDQTVSPPPGGTLTYTIVATVDDPMPDAITNTASVTGPVVRCLPDETLPPCDSPPAIVQRATADLAISKVSAPNPYVPGDPLMYTIIVSNLGPNDAPGSTVTDTFPVALTGVTWMCTASGGATCTASGSGAITDTVDLPVGASLTYAVTASVPSGLTGPLTNVATVTSTTVEDPVPGNNTAQDVNNAQITADLRTSKAGSPNPFVPGETLTYTVVVSNAGPSDVTGAPVQDALPSAFVSAGFTWTCTPSTGANCQTTSGTGNINTFVDLQAGTSATFTLTGTVPSGYTSGADNSATVLPPPDVQDPTPGNNTSTYNNPADIIADLAITKAQSPDPYLPGGTLAYTLQVTNLGPSDVANARVQDVLPAALSGVSWTCAASGTGAACGSPMGMHVVDALVTVPVGTVVTFTVTGTVHPSTVDILTNTATVTPPADVTDPVPGNNEATVNTEGAPEADLEAEKTASPDPYTPGAPLTYTVVVRNNGPSDVLNARVQDLFPAALSHFEWACAPSSGSATCGTASGQNLIDVFVDLPAGSAVTFTATGTVPANATGALTNSATVTPPPGTTDPTPENNTSTTGIGVLALADLSLTKSSSPSPYVPGLPITYTIVATNSGPSVLFGGHVQDNLPAVLQNIQWTCVAAGGTCPAPSGVGHVDALVDIEPGGTVTYTITADVPVGTSGTLVNAATIIPPPGTSDPIPSNNTGTNFNPSPPLPLPVDLQITQEFPSVAPPNGLLTFRLVTRNLGPGAALNPYITGLIPPGTMLVSVNPGPGGIANRPGNPPAPDPVTGYPMPGAQTEPLLVTWPGLMQVGDTHVVEFTVQVAPGTPTGQILWSCFWTWPQDVATDVHHPNNVVDAYLFVDDGLTPVGDLAIQAGVLSEGVIGTALPTRVGVPVPMRFWVTNHGPAASRGQYALILDTANTIQIVDVQLPQGWVSPSGPASAVWDTGPIAPRQTVALDLTVRVLTPGAMELFAQRIAGAPGDPNASNERATIVLDGYAPGLAGRWVAVGNVDGAGAGEVITGAGQGETPQVRVFTGTGADTGVRFFAYERPFAGGVQIASCDVDGDGIDELITAPGPGRAAAIRVLSLVGGVVTELIAFHAFEESFLGGASVACADLDADGFAEIVVGSGPGRAPEVQVYNAATSMLTQRASFLAYEAGFLGGVRVAAGAYPGRAGWLDAFAIVTTPGAGRAPELRLWTETGAPVAQVVVSSATNGVLPTLGDINGDGQLDLLLAPDDGRPELVRIFNVDTGEVLGDVPGGMPAFPVGIRTAVGVLDGGLGQPEIVIGNGPGGHPRVRVIYWPPAGPVQRLEILPIEIP